MKLSKQERIGALIILAIVILALGAFLLIKPKIEAINSASKTLETKRTELQNDLTKQKRKSGLRDDIEAAYQQGEHLADMFFPELTAYEADEAFRAFVRQCKIPVVVEEVTINEPTTATLNVSFFTPSEVTYDLKSYVSSGTDSSAADPNAERMAALQNALAGSQTIGASIIEFTVSALTEEDLLKFADEVNNYFIKDENVKTDDERGIRKAVSITDLQLEFGETNYIWDQFVQADLDLMDTLGGEARTEINIKEENPDTTQSLADPYERVDPTYEPYEEALPYSFKHTLTFYSIERMQNPQAILDEQDGIVNEQTPA